MPRLDDTTDRSTTGLGIVEILAALAAGTASAYSPYAARGISAGANILGAFGERRDRQARDQRIAERLAQEEEEKRLKAETGQNLQTGVDRYIDTRTGFGPPFRPEERGLSLDDAGLAKVINRVAGDSEAVQFIQKRLAERGAVRLQDLQAVDLGEGERLRARSAEGFDYERDVPRKERGPSDTSRAFEDALVLKAEGEDVDHPRVRNLSPERAGQILRKLQEVRHAPRSQRPAASRYSSGAFLDKLAQRAEGFATGDPIADKYSPEQAQRILERRRPAGGRRTAPSVVSGGRTSLAGPPASEDPHAAGKEFLRRIGARP